MFGIVMSNEKQSPFSSPTASMASNFLQTSSGHQDHRNISSPSSIPSSYGAITGSGYSFSDLGIGSHGSPKSTHEDLDAKDDSKLDLYNDVKGLNLAISLPFQDSDHAATNTPQFLSFRPSAGPAGDAMLSAINYNENDILPEALDVNLAGPLPNLDDGILSNMGAPGDLFDGEGNVNDPYSMDDYSPQASHEFGGFGSDGYGIDSDQGLSNPADSSNPMEGFKQQKKPKAQKPAKGQTSPARLNSLQCPTCSKTFTNSSALAKHRLTHSDERKYVCNLCQKAFKRQDHLNGHLMTHREKKPYECSVDNCTKSYCDARSLRRHLENHHNQTPEQIHSAIALVASNAAAVIAAAAATNSAQIKAAQVTTTAGSIPNIASNDSSQGSDIRLLSFSNSSTPVTSPVYGGQINPMFPLEQNQAGSMQLEQENQVMTKQTTKHVVSEEESVGQKVKMLLDQAAAASSQTNTEEVITLHGAQGQQTVTISTDSLPQTITIQPTSVVLKHIQPNRQWHDQNIKGNGILGNVPSNSQSPQEERSPSYYQNVSPISPPVPITQVTPPSPVVQHHPQQRIWNNISASPGNAEKNNGEEILKPAECSICERTFKNVQALNGHMRCHGGYYKKDSKDEKKIKKLSKEMAPPKIMAPKGSKPIVCMPHPSPLDQVGSPQSGTGSTYGSQLQSPVSGESSVGSEAGSALIFQQLGYDQLQIHQQQLQGEQVQQQLQHEIQRFQLEYALREQKIQQLKEQLQHQNQQLTHQQELSMQQELQLQSHLQQQIQQLQQLQADSIQQQLKQHEAQNIILHNAEGHNIKQESHLPEQKTAKQHDADFSILHNPSGIQLIQVLQQNLAKQEVDRQLHDIQQVLKQEADSQAQHSRKQQISQEEMEKHLIQKLYTVMPSTDSVVSFQGLEQQKVSNPTPSQSQHINSIVLEKMKQKQQQQERLQQQMKNLQQTYNSLPTLIHHHPQPRDDNKSDNASVPTSQVTRPSHIQRQVSFEELQNQSHHAVESPSPQQITTQQLQQLLKQRYDVLNRQQRPSNLDELNPHDLRHMDLSPPPITLTPTSIQSNLQTAIAQIPQFALKTPTEFGNTSESFLSSVQVPNLKIPTSSESQDLSLILETIDPFQRPSAKTSQSLGHASRDSSWSSQPVSTLGRLVDAKQSTINYSQMYNEKRHGLEKFHENKNVPLLDSTGHKLGSEHPVYKPEARKPENHSKAAEVNPFPFPGAGGNVAQNDFTRPIDNINNPKHHRHKAMTNQHTELKRRLSIGNEHDLNTSILSGMLNNNKGVISSDKLTSGSGMTYNQSSIKPRMRSKSGDDYKYFRSKSEDHTFMRPRSQTEECLWKYKTKSEDSWDQALSKSDGAGLFRNPNMLSSPLHLRIKRKHRPAPLFIPGHGGSSHGGFQSRLRSPRVLTSEHKGNTPPPYTPPPMLSPIRSGSGLFWTIQKPPQTPMTAPATPRTSLLSSLSRSNSLVGSAQQDAIKSEDIADVEEPPETDIQPHVNIGSPYQAEIPPFNSNRKEALKTVSKEDLVFDPKNFNELSDEEVQSFQEFASSAAVRGNGCNVEYALHLLYMAKGNVQKAILMLMESSKELPVNHTLLSYTYQENDVWSSDEIEKYLNGMIKCDKDFYNISKEIGTKTVKECIQFYYLWKKVSPDEYKRLRIIRHKRERDRLYNLRSQQQQQPSALPEQPEVDMEMNEFEEDSGSSTDMEESAEDMLQEKEDDTSSISTSAPPSVTTSPAPMFTCDYPECNASFNSKQALNGHIRVHGGGSKSNSPAREYRPSQARPPKPHGSPASSEDLNGEGFPCKLCGRVFAKVRSRSAHMKSHRMNESEKKPSKKTVTVPVLDNLIPKMSPNG